MGQQQLLLIVLGVIIVGAAVVAGIEMFTAQETESRKDAVVNEALNLANHIQQFYLKPSEMGGGDGSYVGYIIPSGMTSTGTVSNAGNTDASTANMSLTANTAQILIGWTDGSNYSEWYYQVDIAPPSQGSSGITTTFNETGFDASN